MHKKLVLICLLLLLVGCTEVQDNDNYIESVKNCLNENHITNSVTLGYKFYLPKGVKKIHDYDYNQIFLIDDSYMYLYVDIISYFYEKKLESNTSDNIYYYEEFEYNGNKGYLRIEEKETARYYVQILYHYSKIEGYVSKENLTKVITLSSIILNSIEYHDNVIEKVLEGDLGHFSEFTYEVDKPEEASSSFSQVLEEYVQKEDEIEEKETEQLPDE